MLSSFLDVFANLSDEIVLGIFKHLSYDDLKCATQVSHRFRRLAQDESLWPRFDFASKTLNSNSLAYILKLGVRFLRLKEAKVRYYCFSLDHEKNTYTK